MAVKLYCSVCEKFIKELVEPEIKKITGEELCASCFKKIGGIYADLDKAEAKYKKTIEDKYVALSKEFAVATRFKDQNLSQVKIILSNIRPEIEKMVKEVFKGKEEKE